MANTYKKSSESNKAYIAKHVTDTSKVVIKTKEMGNVSDTLKRLELKSKSPNELLINVADNPDPATLGKNLTWTDQKAKLKHFCKKMSHSKILSKMIALQCASQNEVLDKGTEKLLMKSNQEEILKQVFQAGKVESKVDLFEKPALRPASPPKVAPWTRPKTDSFFSWSKRLNPADNATVAQRHNQFRKYYGYHPGDDHQPSSLLDHQRSFPDERRQLSSLPPFLESLPPPPPMRTNTMPMTKGAIKKSIRIPT